MLNTWINNMYPCEFWYQIEQCKKKRVGSYYTPGIQRECICVVIYHETRFLCMAHAWVIHMFWSTQLVNFDYSMVASWFSRSLNSDDVLLAWIWIGASIRTCNNVHPGIAPAPVPPPLAFSFPWRVLVWVSIFCEFRVFPLCHSFEFVRNDDFVVRSHQISVKFLWVSNLAKTAAPAHGSRTAPLSKSAAVVGARRSYAQLTCPGGGGHRAGPAFGVGT